MRTPGAPPLCVDERPPKLPKYGCATSRAARNSTAAHHSASRRFTYARRESAAWLYVSVLRFIRSSRCRSHQPTMTLRGYGRWHPGTPTLGRAVLCLRACARRRWTLVHPMAANDAACGHATPPRVYARESRSTPTIAPTPPPRRSSGGAPRRSSSPPWSGATRARVLSCAQGKAHARPGPRSRLVLAIARLRRRRPQGATVFSILLSAGSSSVLSVSRLTPHAGDLFDLVMARGVKTK